MSKIKATIPKLNKQWWYNTQYNKKQLNKLYE